jgi:hypothetical protein
MERSRLASWFWLLICIISFVAFAITWAGRPAPLPHALPRTADAAEPDPASAVSAPLPQAGALIETPPPEAAAPVAANRADPIRVMPSDPGTASTTVLRCTLRGRVTYVDPSAACPEGASVKLTVLPR